MERKNRFHLREIEPNRNPNTGDASLDMLNFMGYTYPENVDFIVSGTYKPKRVRVQIDFDNDMSASLRSLIATYHNDNPGYFQELCHLFVNLGLLYYAFLKKGEKLSTYTCVDSDDGYSVRAVGAEHITIVEGVSLYVINKSYPNKEATDKEMPEQHHIEPIEKIVLGETDLPDVNIFAVEDLV